MSQVKLVNVRGSRILPNLPFNLPFIPGNIWHVKPSTGLDANEGDRADRPLKTLLEAQSRATANQNDVVLFYPEGVTAALSSDYQSATLAWAKNMVHLIGVHAGGLYAPRCGIRLASTYVTASNLFTLSASGCYIANMYMYVGVASANPTGCMAMTGSYNHLYRCHMAGMGASTNVIAAAYSLSMTAAEANFIEECTIGYEQMRGAQVSAEIYINAGTKHNTFSKCLLYTSTSHATNHVFARVADSFAGFIDFDRCRFVNEGLNGGGAEMTYAFAPAGSNPGGVINLHYCSSAGVTDWSNNSGFVWAPTLTDGTITGGIGVVQTKS